MEHLLEHAYYLFVDSLFGYIVYSCMFILLLIFIVRANHIARWRNNVLSNSPVDQDKLPIVVLIPNRNEEYIDKTIQSILSQTKKPEHVIIIFNNMTDEGYSYNLAKNILGNDSVEYTLLDMGQNPNLKAGALNFGYSWMLENLDSNKIEYVCQMDSDSELEQHFLERTYAGMLDNPNIGALSSCFEGKKNLLKKKKLLYWLQNFEYVKYHNSSIVKQANVISGTGNLLRIEALNEIQHAWETVWDSHSIVEDYTLTLRLKMLNWKTLKSTKFIVFTDLMPSIRRLIHQRLRWQRGTFDTLLKHGINRVTIWEYLKETKFLTLVLLEFGVYSILLNGALQQYNENLSIIYAVIPLVIINVYNLYYLKNYRVGSILLIFSFLPIFFYNLLRIYWWIYSLMTVRTKKWSE